jgi:hypothetical protein
MDHPLLTPQNYQKGFLVDPECMAGVTEDPEHPGHYCAFVLKHTSGEYLGYQPFSDLDSALQAVNQIPRTWSFERLGGCGSGQCGKNSAGGCCSSGSCSRGAC